MRRLFPLENNEIYHVYNKSISKFVIFNSAEEYQRMIQVIQYYSYANNSRKFSAQLRAKYPAAHPNNKNPHRLVRIIAYCLMPTHYHLVLLQYADDGISKFIGNAQNSYTRYFNLRHNRKGPLWQNRFQNNPVESSDGLLNLTKYVHLNPIKSNLVPHPKHWHYSSYLAYIKNDENLNEISLDLSQINLKGKEYQKYITTGTS